MRIYARLVVLGLFALASVVLLTRRSPARFAPVASLERVVYLGGQLTDEQLISFGAAVASRPEAVLLLDSPELTPHLRRFLAEFRPDRIVPVGEFVEGQAGLSKRLGFTVEPIVAWSASSPVCPLWREQFPRPESVVIAAEPSRRQLLEAATAAARHGLPLWITRRGEDGPHLSDWLGKMAIKRVSIVGEAKLKLPAGVRRRKLAEPKNPQTLLLANPADHLDQLGGMSALAPWLAATRQAGLVLTNSSGSDVAPRVEQFMAGSKRSKLDHLLVLGTLEAIPTWQRPNPIPGDKDMAIELEPLTPTVESQEPVSYAVGRLFHQNLAVVPLMLARQRLDQARVGTRRALVASNPGGGLPMLEAFSRSTAQELRNAGYDVTELYGRRLNGQVLREQFARHQLVLWEGHHNTLVRDWHFLDWDEPLSNSLVVLQSCLALMPQKVQPLLTRGAYAVVGTSTRTYSASGGAFSLAYLDALLYEQQTLGGALRQAKNFLLAYATLKEQRLGEAARRTGANHRAAWAFSLWGDPTYRLPSTSRPPELAPVRHEVAGNEIVLRVPQQQYDLIHSEAFRVQMPPNARLAGLVRKGDARQVVPFVFVEVPLPNGKANLVPKLRTKVPARSWVFLWDARRRVGWLLVTPRVDPPGEMRFRVEWTPIQLAHRAE